MKTLKVEAIDRIAGKTFAEFAADIPRSIDEVHTACRRHSAVG
jgi:hypothetical protein